MNSVIFRSAGQGLTVPGTYVEMTSRLVEPVLLALVLLAVRGRVKRFGPPGDAYTRMVWFLLQVDRLQHAE
ncbi:hypothetical protein AB0P05_43030 [Streptomyces flaveolus]|uniref:hypothetical protein n=1 Tax=Streptomyces flaveolus TaxID=67297 RepID=UPI0034465269